jgi:hypothetical protein
VGIVSRALHVCVAFVELTDEEKCGLFPVNEKKNLVYFGLLLLLLLLLGWA